MFASLFSSAPAETLTPGSRKAQESPMYGYQDLYQSIYLISICQ